MPTLSLVCLLVLPWLNPFSFGPTPSVVPWLFSVLCATAILGLLVRLSPDHRVVPWPIAVVCGWLARRRVSAVIGLIQYAGASAELTPWINTTSAGEAYGNLRQRNQFASLTNIGVAVLLWRLGDVPWGAVARRGQGLGAVLLMVLLVAANAASASRTGLVQLALVLAMFALWQRKPQPVCRDARFLAAAVGYVLAALLFAALAGGEAPGGGILGRVQGVGGPMF